MTNPQRLFFRSLKSNLPSHLNLSQIVSQILNISLNEAYKKIKGESSLNFQQLVQLCDELKYTYHYEPEQVNTILFYEPRIDSQKNEMESYLHDIFENLQRIHQLKHKHITITTDDIPLFHFFKYPELTAFKLFFWADSMGIPNADFKEFKLSDELMALTKALYTLYLEIPSTEIWSKDTIQGTIEQVRYAFEAGYIGNSELAQKILEQLKQCLADINSHASNSKKTGNAKHTFSWYACDVLGSICYLVDGNGFLTSFNRFNTFNYIKTENTRYCEQTRTWMNGLIKKSDSFSGNGEKQRNKYLNNAYFEINRAILAIRDTEPSPL